METDTHYYYVDDWAVRRWDKFNAALVTPKSFCQFWRTVLLWATLASIPLIGKVFLAGGAGHLIQGIVSVASLVWRVLLTAKHRICPAIRIVRLSRP